VADEADDLYGLPLDAFVAERDALAKRLRADKKRDEADAVKALRKPSVAAWGVNQAVRSQPKAARALWKAGDALIAAQDDLLAGKGDAAALRAATEGERDAVDALMDAARGLLTGEGRDLGEATLERVRDTLHAAAIDPEARDDVAAGRADRERSHAGLGAFGGAVAPTPARRSSGSATKTPKARGRVADKPEEDKPKARATKKQAGPTKAQREAEEKRAAAEERKATAERERERREAARAKSDAERELREARKALEKAERAADRANARLEEVQAVADEANAALDDAQAREAAAVDALERAGGTP
jgi:hypothetical protein